MKTPQLKIFFRVANPTTQQGLWYDFKGKFTGLIHNKFSFCENSKLEMPFNPELTGWLSATNSIEDLFYWFTPLDILRLQSYGYYVVSYSATDYKKYNNHWLINQKTSEFIRTMPLELTQEKTNLINATKQLRDHAVLSIYVATAKHLSQKYSIKINQQP